MNRRGPKRVWVTLNGDGSVIGVNDVRREAALTIKELNEPTWWIVPYVRAEKARVRR